MSPDIYQMSRDIYQMAQTFNKCFRHLSNSSPIYQIFAMAQLRLDFLACSGTYEWKYQITVVEYGCPDVQYGSS